MIPLSVRLARSIMWLVLVILVLAAFAISGLRFVLPHLNEYREPIRQWVSAQAGMRIEFDHVEGQWRSLAPSLVLQKVSVNLPDEPDSVVKMGDISLQLDMLGSVMALSPVFSDMRIDRMSLDLTALGNLSAPAAGDNSKLATISRLEDILFVQLGQFSLPTSDITIMSPADERMTLAIQELKWVANSKERRAEGIVSVRDTHFSQMQVMANLSAAHSLRDLTGQVYVQTRNLSMTPWLNKVLLQEGKILSSNLNTQAWLTLQEGQLKQARVKLDDSYLRWQKGDTKHRFRVRKGLVDLKPYPQADGRAGWRLDTDQFVFQTDKQQWPAFDLAAIWQPDGWQLALNQLSLTQLRPFLDFLPPDFAGTEVLTALQPGGLVQNLRIAATAQNSPRFSFSLTDYTMNQWELLPGVHNLHADVAGDLGGGKAVLSLQDDDLPYGNVFQAPLNIGQGEVTAYWQVGKDGWRLWSDHLKVSNPHLEAAGQFRLDFPANAPAWLSFYGEATAKRAGETWRYLPTLALGDDLTDYLSAAIRGGQAKDAQLLWYGELADFPYADHNGVFQAKVPLRNGKFSFDTAWPELTDLTLDLLFENDWMYLDASQAHTMGAKASRVSGAAELSDKGHLKLAIDVAADGEQVRDYMLATPLVDSVGAALTTVQVSGPVTSSFQLDIPFDGSDVRAWGKASLADNQVMLDAPPIPLERVSGDVQFDNDVVQGKNLTATMLGQPVTLGFDGHSVAKGYRVDVNFGGDWDIASLRKAVPHPLLDQVSGTSRWDGKVGVDLHDTGFDYQVGLTAGLGRITSTLPYPLGHPSLKSPSLKNPSQKNLTLSARGNQQSLTGTLKMQDAAYQARIKLQPQKVSIAASELVVGRAPMPPLKNGEHGVTVMADHFDADRWIALLDTASPSGSSKPAVSATAATTAKTTTGTTTAAKTTAATSLATGTATAPPSNQTASVATPVNKVPVKTATASAASDNGMPELPVPNRVTAEIKQLTLGTLDWNRVSLTALRQQAAQALSKQSGQPPAKPSARGAAMNEWQVTVDSRELKGKAVWPTGQPVRLDLDEFHLNLPILAEDAASSEVPSSGELLTASANAPATVKPRQPYQPQPVIPTATALDRRLMASIPEVDLTLRDGWLQGYRLGKVSGQLRRGKNMLELVNFTIDSGTTTLNLDGHWSLRGARNETQLAFDIDGKNSSDLMGRFGISGGIQGAEFSTYASIQWQGAPWSMHRETLSGEVKSETGQGVISDIGGAGRLLGLFSLDSIIRKMKLDFSGIFDDGLAFNYIRGTGRIENGLFTTSDIRMEALAGDMFIQGSANLVKETVDAKVKFIPDFTSGIPVLTAFAVAPQTALYVFAISTALSPVLDVFTQVNYVVQGPIDAPLVTEQSRFTGEYKVPEAVKSQENQ
nr:YhdP family protein [Photobacterium ganghwense]